MSFARQTAAAGGLPVAKAKSEERATFIRKTYAHLAGAVGLFVLLEVIWFRMPFTPKLISLMWGTRYSWLVVLGLFMVVGWVADSWARSATSKTMQYAGLGLYVLAESVIFVPLLWVATYYAKSDVLTPAILVTGGLFTGLTGTVLITRKDFSFLRTILVVGSFIALGAIVAAIVFGFHLGTLFSLAMVVLAAGFILYSTSNVLHHYRTDQYVSASLALFAAVALMFWYILQLFLSRD